MSNQLENFVIIAAALPKILKCSCCLGGGYFMESRFLSQNKSYIPEVLKSEIRCCYHTGLWYLKIVNRP